MNYPTEERRQGTGDPRRRGVSLDPSSSTAQEYREIDGRRVPVVTATPDRDGIHVSFRCAHCRSIHSHGDIPIGSVEHRNDHCWRPGSPYAITGYLVRVVERERRA